MKITSFLINQRRPSDYTSVDFSWCLASEYYLVIVFWFRKKVKDYEVYGQMNEKAWLIKGIAFSGIEASHLLTSQ